MLTTLISLVAAPPAPAPALDTLTISGTALHRERIALPSHAELVVRLEASDVDSGGTVRLAEVRMRLNGRQVPIRFQIPYLADPSAPPSGLRAWGEVVADGRRLMATAQPEPVRPRRALVLLLRSGVAGDGAPGSGSAPEALVGRTWELVELEGRPVTFAERPPTLAFAADADLRGFSGVNGFGGRYRIEAGRLTIEPGAMTMMAGPPERMAVETSFLGVLPKVDGYQVDGANLALRRGGETLAKFRAADPSL